MLPLAPWDNDRAQGDPAGPGAVGAHIPTTTEN